MQRRQVELDGNTLPERAPAEPRAALAAAIAGGDISAFLEVWLRGDLLPAEESSVLREYYRSYVRCFGTYLKHHYRSQTRELMALLSEAPAAQVLEIGCGCGTESLWMAARGHEVTAVDVSRPMLKVAVARRDVVQQVLGRRLACDLRQESVLDMNGGPYDLIWMEQAFHHLEPRAAVVEKIESLLRPGGWLVICEANAWNPITQLMMFRLRGTRTVITYNGVSWGNERFLTATALRREFERCGIEQTSLRYFRVLPNRRWADGLTAWLGMFDDADRWWMRLLYLHYNYVGRKRA